MRTGALHAIPERMMKAAGGNLERVLRPPFCAAFMCRKAAFEEAHGMQKIFACRRPIGAFVHLIYENSKCR